MYTECKHGLKNTGLSAYEKRQVFDVPPLQIETTEHLAEQKQCPHCRHVNRADFPADVEQSTQYGSGIKGLAIYLNQYQFLPYERLQVFFKDILGHSISQGMLVKMNQQCYKKLAIVDEGIKCQLIGAKNLHHDETGLRVNKKMHWCHVASTDTVTHYGIHQKRGKEGIDVTGILPYFTGRLIHDFLDLILDMIAHMVYVTHII